MHEVGPGYYQVMKENRNAYRFSDFFSHIESVLSPDVEKRLSEPDKLDILVFGSAAAQNVRSLLSFEESLGRGEKLVNDRIIIADINEYPLRQHQEYESELRALDALPHFDYLQMNIHQPALVSNSVDLIISDFTFNFNSKLNEVERMFHAAQETLRARGIMFASMRGNPDFIDSDTYGPIQERAPENAFERRLPMMVDSCYPLAAYVRRANKYNLQLISYERADVESSYIINKDFTEENYNTAQASFPILYGVFQKEFDPEG